MQKRKGWSTKAVEDEDVLNEKQNPPRSRTF